MTDNKNDNPSSSKKSPGNDSTLQDHDDDDDYAVGIDIEETTTGIGRPPTSNTAADTTSVVHGSATTASGTDSISSFGYLAGNNDNNSNSSFRYLAGNNNNNNNSNSSFRLLKSRSRLLLEELEEQDDDDEKERRAHYDEEKDLEKGVDREETIKDPPVDDNSSLSSSHTAHPALVSVLGAVDGASNDISTMTTNKSSTTTSTSIPTTTTTTHNDKPPMTTKKKKKKKIDTFDDDMLRAAIANVGEWAAGVVYIQLWVLNEHHNRLIQPTAGYWLDPKFHENCTCHHNNKKNKTNNKNNTLVLGDHMKDISTSSRFTTTSTSTPISTQMGLEIPKMIDNDCPLCRLVDKKHPKYIPAEPLPIGSGLAGMLWSTMAQPHHHGTDHHPPHHPSSSHHHTSMLKWRDLGPIADDPDQAWNPRLQHLAKNCGFGKVAGVPFHLLGEEGMIVCMTRATPYVDMERLTCPTNDAFLLSSAQVIGSVFLFRGTRREAVVERQIALEEKLSRAKHRILVLRGLGVSMVDILTGNGGSHNIEGLNIWDDDALIEEVGDISHRSYMSHGSAFSGRSRRSSHHHLHAPKTRMSLRRHSQKKRRSSGGGAKPFSFWSRPSTGMILLEDFLFPVYDRFIDTILKCQGAGVQAPPGFDTIQASWTFVGVFLTMLLLTNLNRFLVDTWGMDSSFSLPPFGAFLTLLYGLTAAPASQPRNAILGQAVSLSIALGISYLDFMEPWLKQSLATSLAISIMVKFSITHPPAGAAAMIFSGGKMRWSNMAFMLVANVIAILAATLINNMSTKRQYPTSWGFGNILTNLRTVIHSKNKSVKKH